MSKAIRRPVIGVGVVALRGPRVLLVKRANPPRAGEWSLPGGHQEWGETVEEAARRELFEEAGLYAEALQLLAVADGIVRDAAGTVSHHFTLIDFWTEITAVSPAARAGDDAAELRWTRAEEIDCLVEWAETRHVCHLAFARRDSAKSRSCDPNT